MRGLGWVCLVLLMLAGPADATERIALLIGNQNYSARVGPLKNPHNDIARIGAALRLLKFQVTEVKDADYRTVDTSINRHIQNVRRAGKDSISLVYYAGHGAANPETKINYLIPVDVANADDEDLWTNSVNLNKIVESLREQAPAATHYVVFDACRNELNLTHKGTRSLADRGFVAISHPPGVMIAYATAPGKTATDAGAGAGVYASALAEEIVKPGVEALEMFRKVALRVHRQIGQDPWMAASTLPEKYFAGSKIEEQQFWDSVKASGDPATLATYLHRYPDGDFAIEARALIEQHRLQRQMEQQSREQEQKRRQDAERAAEMLKQESELQAREAALVEQQQQRKEAKESADALDVSEKHRLEAQARAEALKKANEEAQAATAETKAAEARIKQALAATDAAKGAARAKEDAKGSAFDGAWRVVRLSPDCLRKEIRFQLTIQKATVRGEEAGPITGSISPTGAIRFQHTGASGVNMYKYSGTLKGNVGSGTFVAGACGGSFTARRS
jgi:uncharacterized caspase-like protein